MGVISGLISGGLGIAQGLIDSWTQKRNVERTVSANKELADYQYSKDLDMWNRANVYNLPENQMKRLEAAGINPALMYGNSAPGNVATTLPRYQAPSVSYDYKPPVNLGDVISMYNDMRVTNAQIDNLREQRRIRSAEADLKEAEAGYANGKARLKQDILSSQASIMDFKREVEAQQFHSLFKVINDSEGNAIYYPRDINWFDSVIRKKFEKPAYELDRTQASIRDITLQADLKQIEKNWAIADRLAGIITKAVGAVGVGKFIGGIGRGNTIMKGSQGIMPTNNPIGKLKRITNKYYE